MHLSRQVASHDENGIISGEPPDESPQRNGARHGTQSTPSPDANEPAPGASARSPAASNAARSRAEQRVQRFLDAAFELIDEKGTTEFTIQEVIDRSKQSLRGFYEYFDGKDELVLALFEETVREAGADIRAAVDGRIGSARPTARLHDLPARVVRPRRGAAQARHPQPPARSRSSRCTWRSSHPERVRAALAPVSHLLRELVDAAAEAGVIHVDDARRAATLVQQTVMYSWFGNRLVENPETAPHRRGNVAVLPPGPARLNGSPP